MVSLGLRDPRQARRGTSRFSRVAAEQRRSPSSDRDFGRPREGAAIREVT